MTREDVIRQIVQRELSNQLLTNEAVLQEAAELHAAACEYFGTWDTALQYAGISTRRVITHYSVSPDSILQRIRKMCFDGYDMSVQQNIRRDRRFHEAARLYFGSWENAITAAGVDRKRVRLLRKTRKLDKDEILFELLKRHEAGLSIKCADVCREDCSLATAAKYAFHSWGRALAAAGLGPTQPERGKKWSKEIILAAIKDRRRSGRPCNYVSVQKEESNLISAARRYFGNWRSALQAAAKDGVDL